jgi:hypothetical protein
MSPARKSRFQTVQGATAPTAEPARPASVPAESPEPEEPQDRPGPLSSRPGRVPAKAVQPKYNARMSLTLPEEMKQALEMARVMDKIEGTARIRAMIRLWQTDERLRRRVDRAALEEKD